MTILVTGGAGFIGSNFLHHLIKTVDEEIICIDLIRMILDRMNMKESMIEYVEDRPGHDRRYSTDITKIRHELKWTPRFSIEQGLDKTIEWYERNRN